MGFGLATANNGVVLVTPGLVWVVTGVCTCNGLLVSSQYRREQDKGYPLTGATTAARIQCNLQGVPSPVQVRVC